jgi:hypothetical protein
MHDDMARELKLELVGTCQVACSPGGRAPNSADHAWNSLERFVSRAIASILIFTLTSHHHIAFLPSSLQIRQNIRYI